MKKSASSFILLTALGYTYLFYNQLPGINYLLFDLLLIILLAITQKEQLFRKSVGLTCLGMVLSSLFIFVHNTTAPLLLHWISFALFVRLFYEPDLSLYLAFGEQVYISVLSIFRPFKWRKLSRGTEQAKGTNWAVYMLTLPVVGLFILLYSSGNALYSQLVSKVFEIDLNFGLFFFFLSGIVLAFSIFAPSSSGLWIAFDLVCSNDLEKREEITISSVFGTLSNELKAGVFLLFMLNLVTLSLHITDIYSFCSHSYASSNPSEIVHQGVNSLIISILLAILIVVYFFRGELNFISENKILKNITYVWLIQNIGLVVSTCYKDLLYISEHGLTHKRIGVLIWLTIVLLGVIYTFLKIHHKRSVWYLLRLNTWTVYVVLIAYAGVHWDRWIIQYNTNCSECEIDYNYFQKLDISAFADIQALDKHQRSKIPTNNLSYQTIKAAQLVKEYQTVTWPSFNLENERIAQVFAQSQPSPNVE